MIGIVGQDGILPSMPCSLDALYRKNCRIFFPPELETLLHYNGFTVLERYGDWNAGPLADESQTMIFICKRASSALSAFHSGDAS